MAITRKNLFGKLDATLFKGIESATTICKLRGNPYVELIHWVNQLWHQDDNDLKQIVRYFALDVDAIERGLAQAFTLTANLTTGLRTGWSPAANTQSTGKVFTADITVSPVLVGTITMGEPITEDVEIDGSMTMNFAFGI